MPTTFKDKKGREWDVALDLRKARQIDKSDFKQYWDQEFSILELKKDLIQKLLTDAPFLFAIIWAMVQDQAEASYQSYEEEKDRRFKLTGHVFNSPPEAGLFPISPKEAEAAELEFVSGVNGPVIEAARQAFMEALGDFFPDQRIVLFTFASQLKKMGERVGKKMEQSIPLLEEIMEEEMEAGVKTLAENLRKDLAKQRGKTSTESQQQPVL